MADEVKAIPLFDSTDIDLTRSRSMKHACVLLIASVFVVSAVAADPLIPPKPNVIFILADDSGFADFGC